MFITGATENHYKLNLQKQRRQLTFLEIQQLKQIRQTNLSLFKWTICHLTKPKSTHSIGLKLVSLFNLFELLNFQKEVNYVCL